MRFFLLFVIQLFCILSGASAQQAGLYFNSYEKVQEKRTGIELSPDQPFCADKQLNLSFEVRFRPNQRAYYGYIFRTIISPDINVDLINEDFSTQSRRFSLVVGDKQQVINLPAESANSYPWLNISLKISLSDQMVQLRIGNKQVQIPLALKEKFCSKVYLGAFKSPGFSSSDVPPIFIKNIHLTTDADKEYFWPLGESDGKQAKDKLQGTVAMIQNPVWVNALHQHWKHEATLKTSTAGNVAFDALNEVIYFIGRNSIQSYDINKEKAASISYAQGTHDIRQGAQSLYIPLNNKLVHYYPDAGFLESFDFSKKSWSSPYPRTTAATGYWHTNKFFNRTDSALYVLGGYGYRTYKNSIFKISLHNSTYDTVHVDGEFAPRYLAGLGAWKQGAYILGGYGSKTGKQELNPKYQYDLLYFDPVKKTIRTIYNLAHQGEDFVFANSLVIDSLGQNYYGLIHSKDRYDTQLKLIKGSLSKPEFTLLADSIPFKFHDIQSFADLYFAAQSEKLIAVTLFDNGEETQLAIYSIEFPPSQLLALQNTGDSTQRKTWIWILFSAIALGLIGFWLGKRGLKVHLKHPEPEAQKSPALREHRPTEASEFIPNVPNSIYLFGGFQVFDNASNDITKAFTPVVRELFLAILLYTVRTGRGISSESLYELIWSDKSIESARNNRSVNTAKLKGILKKMDAITVSKETGYWKIHFDEQRMFIDYAQFWACLNAKYPAGEKLIKITSFIQKGDLFPDLEYPWLDDFKSEVSTAVADLYQQALKDMDLFEEPEFNLQIANCIASFDPMNEDAMVIRCILMSRLGMHTQAQTVYQNFVAEYTQIYGETFGLSLKEVLQKHH